MSNEIFDENALIAALKETQQVVSQLQKPLESLALTQLIGLTYKAETIAGHMDTWRTLLGNEMEQSVELSNLVLIEEAKAAKYSVNLDKEENLRKIQSLEGLLEGIKNEKNKFEREHPLIVKLVKQIDAIE